MDGTSTSQSNLPLVVFERPVRYHSCQLSYHNKVTIINTPLTIASTLPVNALEKPEVSFAFQQSNKKIHCVTNNSYFVFKLSDRKLKNLYKNALKYSAPPFHDVSLIASQVWHLHFCEIISAKSQKMEENFATSEAKRTTYFSQKLPVAMLRTEIPIGQYIPVRPYTYLVHSCRFVYLCAVRFVISGKSLRTYFGDDCRERQNEELSGDGVRHL